MTLGQIPRTDGSQIKERMRFFVILPVIVLLGVISVTQCSLGIVFIIRFSVYVWTKYLDHWW